MASTRQRTQSIWNSFNAETAAQIKNYIQATGGNPEDVNTVLGTVDNIGAGIIKWDDVRQQPTKYLNPEERALEQQKTEEQAEVEKFRTGREQALADLLSRQKSEGQEYLESYKTRRQDRLSALSELLTKQREEAFQEQSPVILEELGARGLLHSSAVGEEFASAKESLQTQAENILRQQELSDLENEARLGEDILTRQLGLENKGFDFLSGIDEKGMDIMRELGRAGLERKFSLADFEREAQLAKDIANMQSDSQKRSDMYSLGGQLLSAGSAAGTTGAVLAMSDIRLKENIKKIGTVSIYEFDYKDGFGLPAGRRVGVMAQELEEVVPSAVVEKDGYKMVDYSIFTKGIEGGVNGHKE